MAMERAREPSTPGRAPTCKLSAGRVHAMTSVMTERRAIEDLAIHRECHFPQIRSTRVRRPHAAEAPPTPRHLLTGSDSRQTCLSMASERAREGLQEVVKKSSEHVERAREGLQEVVKKSSEHVKHVGRLAEQHLAAIKGTSSAGLSYSNPHVVYAVAGVAVIVLLVLIYCLCVRRSSKTYSSPSKRTKNSRNLMPVFDVEGGSSTSHGNGNERVLHPSISTAAANADVATLRTWLATDRCVVDAALAVDGSTALHHAARAGHANIVRLLLDHGADSLVVDSELRTPLHHVAALGHGCVASPASRAWQAPRVALRDDIVDALRFLGSARRAVRPACAPCGDGALATLSSPPRLSFPRTHCRRHLAPRLVRSLCVKALLDAGADPESRDGAGRSCLALAEAGRHMGTARMMRLHLERRAAETGTGSAGLRPRSTS